MHAAPSNPAYRPLSAGLGGTFWPFDDRTTRERGFVNSIHTENAESPTGSLEPLVGEAAMSKYPSAPVGFLTTTRTAAWSFVDARTSVTLTDEPRTKFTNPASPNISLI